MRKGRSLRESVRSGRRRSRGSFADDADPGAAPDLRRVAPDGAVPGRAVVPNGYWVGPLADPIPPPEVLLVGEAQVEQDPTLSCRRAEDAWDEDPVHIGPLLSV